MKDEVRGRAWLKWCLVGGIGVVIALGVLAAPIWPSKLGCGQKRPFFYDMEPLRQIDPALIQYAEERRIQTGFKKVGGMALRADGAVLVAGDSAVRVFKQDGTLSSEIKLSGPVRCVAVGGDGKVYAGLQEHVEVYDAQGGLAAKWASLGLEARITALAATAEDVFVADSAGRIVLRCDRSGHARNKIGARDAAKEIPGFVLPSPYLDVAFGADGLLYANNPGRHRIEAYTPAGDLERHWGKPSMEVDGYCGCCNPISFALRPGGGFVTSEKGLARVKLLDADGNLEAVVAAPESFGEDAFGIDVAVDEQGRVYVLDLGTRAVLIFKKAKGAEK